MTDEFAVVTKNHDEFIDITSRIQDTIRSQAGAKDGFVVVFVPHTTAGVTINENSDSDVQTDMIRQLDKMVPWDAGYRHIEGNSAAHLKASLVGSSVTIPFSGGRLVLGTWQAIYFCEFDGPWNRKVVTQVLSGT